MLTTPNTFQMRPIILVLHSLNNLLFVQINIIIRLYDVFIPPIKLISLIFHKNVCCIIVVFASHSLFPIELLAILLV